VQPISPSPDETEGWGLTGYRVYDNMLIVSGLQYTDVDRGDDPTNWSPDSTDERIINSSRSTNRIDSSEIGLP
jgi:hypothetical protein